MKEIPDDDLSFVAEIGINAKTFMHITVFGIVLEPLGPSFWNFNILSPNLICEVTVLLRIEAKIALDVDCILAQVNVASVVDVRAKAKLMVDFECLGARFVVDLEDSRCAIRGEYVRVTSLYVIGTIRAPGAACFQILTRNSAGRLGNKVKGFTSEDV